MTTITETSTEELLVLLDDHGILIFNKAADIETGIQNWWYAPQAHVTNKADHRGPFMSMRSAALSACLAYGIRPVEFNAA